MIEAFFRTLKQYSIYKKVFYEFNQAKNLIDIYLGKYNEFIPRNALGGNTPLEKYKGSNPILCFQKSLSLAMKRRKSENRQICKLKCLNLLNT